MIMSLLFESRVLACISARKTKDERERTSHRAVLGATLFLGVTLSSLFSCGFTVFKKEGGY